MFFNRYYQPPQGVITPTTPIQHTTFQSYPVPEASNTSVGAQNFPVKAFITISKRCKRQPHAISKVKKAPEEIRRFRTAEDISFEQLKQRISTVAKLQERQLEITSVKYRDEEGDFVNCDSEEEWSEALLNGVATQKVCVVHIAVCKPASEEEEEEKAPVSPRVKTCKRSTMKKQPKKEEMPQEEGERTEAPKKSLSLHRNIVCDGCMQHGILGTRYKCVQCSDFDLCEQCYEQRDKLKHENHQFLKIETPIAIPAFCDDISFIIVNPHVEQQQEVKQEENKKQEEEVEPVVEQQERVEEPAPVVEEAPKVEHQEQEDEEPIIEQVLEEEVVVEKEPEQQEIVAEEIVAPVQQPQPTAPVVEQQPVQKPIDPTHATTLEILKQMGFTNEALALFLIRKHNNNVQRVVDEYLNHQ